MTRIRSELLLQTFDGGRTVEHRHQLVLEEPGDLFTDVGARPNSLRVGVSVATDGPDMGALYIDLTRNELAALIGHLGRVLDDNPDPFADGGS